MKNDTPTPESGTKTVEGSKHHGEILEHSLNSAETSSLKTIIIAVAMAQFMNPFMVSGLSPLLPALGADLKASAVEISLVGTIFALSLTIFHLIAGRMGDIFGRKYLFLFGVTLFTCMSGLMPFSPNIYFFLTMRFFQAAGVAMMNTSALTILVNSAPKADLGRVLAIASLGMYAGLSFGPGVAGLVGTFGSWKYIFFGVVPLGVLVWIVIALIVKGNQKEALYQGFDWTGSVLFTLGMVGLFIGGVWLSEGWWASGVLALGFVFLGLFVRAEIKSTHPMLDIGFIVGNWLFRMSLITSYINYCSTFGVMFYFSLYLQIVKHYSILETGLILSVQPLIQIFIAPRAGKLGDKKGHALIATWGMGFCGMGLLLSSLISANSELWLIVCIQLVLGFGVAVFVAPNTAATMESVDTAHVGQASGLVGTVRTLGMLSGLVIISLTMNSYLGVEPLNQRNIPEFLGAMHNNFILFGVVNVLGVLLSIKRLRELKTRNAK